MKKVKAHVLDSSAVRRGQMARALTDLGAHAEIYENINELVARPLASGFLIANHDTIDGSVGEADIGKLIGLIGLPVSIYDHEPFLPRVVRAMLEGAFDYTSWPISEDKLADLVCNAEQFQRTKVQEMKDRSEAIDLIASLSSREREVLGLAIGGHSNKSSARVLDLSPRTVEIHRANAFKKINARSVAEAIRIGIQAGLG